MSMGSLGPLASAAGTPLSQRSTDSSKAQQSNSDSARAADSARSAEQASGIGTTDEEHEATDRDADGQKIWEDAPDAQDQETSDEKPRRTRPTDPDGETGQVLDLDG